MEWVFFNAAQVLPCYIIRLRSTGVDDQQPHHQLPPLLQKYQEEANSESDNAKRRQEKLLARVTKTTTLWYHIAGIFQWLQFWGFQDFLLTSKILSSIFLSKASSWLEYKISKSTLLNPANQAFIKIRLNQLSIMHGSFVISNCDKHLCKEDQDCIVVSSRQASCYKNSCCMLILYNYGTFNWIVTCKDGHWVL